MVERPIKKSERQAVAEPNDDIEVQETEASTAEGNQDFTPLPEKQSAPRPLLGKDKSKAKGRGKEEKESRSARPPANPALMRGPKPTKPKPPVVQETPEVSPESSVTEPLENEAEPEVTTES